MASSNTYLISICPFTVFNVCKDLNVQCPGTVTYWRLTCFVGISLEMAAVTVKEESEDPDYYQYNVQGNHCLMGSFFLTLGGGVQLLEPIAICAAVPVPSFRPSQANVRVLVTIPVLTCMVSPGHLSSLSVAWLAHACVLSTWEARASRSYAGRPRLRQTNVSVAASVCAL